MDKHSAILITGAGGFVGKNLCAALRCRGYGQPAYVRPWTPRKEALREYAQQAAFVFHLAGVNRPKDPSEFYAGNRGFTEELLHLLAQAGNKAPRAGNLLCAGRTG